MNDPIKGTSFTTKVIAFTIMLVITTTLSCLWWTERTNRIEAEKTQIILEYDIENIIKEKAKLTTQLIETQSKIDSLKLSAIHANNKSLLAERSLGKVRKHNSQLKAQHEEELSDLFDRLDSHVNEPVIDSLRTKWFSNRFN